MKRIDLKDKVFGEWTVLEYIGNRHWLCECSCKKKKSVHTYKLTSGQSKSCGHAKNELIDIKDQVFGEWTVLEYVGNHMWKCKCSCGEIKNVNSIYLRNGSSTSCGHSTTKFKDIKEQTFGEWTAIKYLGNTLWLCKCSCGKEKSVKLYDLLNGRTNSCGHSTTGFIDLKDKVFGYWTVKEYQGNQNWLCVCKCGTVKVINSQRIRMGRTNSCGCMSKEISTETYLKRYGVPHNSQKHRTMEQIEYTSSIEHLKNHIINTFGTLKPTPKQLSNTCGLQPSRMMKIVRNFSLEDMIDINKPVSSYENELNELFPCNNRSDREILNGKEIDLYYPKNNLGIEFNGSYWHSEIYKDEKYHQDKSLSALTKNTNLVHIFEYEWVDEEKKEKLIRLLNRKFDSNRVQKIYARNCKVITVDNEECTAFLEDYHLQGNANASIKLGLEYEGNLIGVMTFGKPRFNSEYQYELIRLCWRDDIIVIGGAEKLFKHFEEKYNPLSVISYCDVAKFSGKVYKNLGFKLESITPPNYVWVDIVTNEYLSRYQTQKHKLVELGLGTEEQTEVEIMHELGFVRIYDCGNFKFTWQRGESNNG